MITLKVLAAGVCLVLGLQAADDWTTRQQAAKSALQKRNYAEAIRLYGECVSLSANDGQRVAALASYGIALNRADRNVEAKVALEQALTAREGGR